MNLYFFTQIRLCRIDGVVWTTPAFSMPLWERYLQVFDHVYVVARITNTDKPIADAMTPLTSKRVSFIDLPYYVGPKQYLKVKSSIYKIIESLIHPGDAYLCRVPGRIGSIAVKYLLKKKVKYGIEVVGDPWESMSPQASKHILAPFFQVHGYRSLRHVAKNASAALYVTQHTLQDKYPVREGVFSTNASNVIVRDEYIAQSPKQTTDWGRRTLRLLSVGTLAQLYKAPDIVVKAIAELVNRGYNISFTWLGGGQFLEPMREMAQNLGIGDVVDFRGAVSLDEVRNELDNADLFVHASRAEGLPRAVIEAMAKGLPAVGSTVAGIPELLDKKALVPPNNVKKLANTIAYFIDHPAFAAEQAEKNWKEARKYHESILSSNRLNFYKELKRVSE